MNETPAPQLPSPAPQKRDHVVAITAIIATAVILLVCMAGTAGVIITAIMNAQ